MPTLHAVYRLSRFFKKFITIQHLKYPMNNEYKMFQDKSINDFLWLMMINTHITTSKNKIC